MWKTCIASLTLAVILVGCSKLMPKLDQVLPDNRTEYKKSKTLPDLEIPPDLTTEAIRDVMAIPKAGEGETASFSTYQERVAARKREQELERSESGAIKLLENEHILAVQGVTAQIWPQLGAFWGSLGYELELDDEELGVIETTWNENQEELVRDKFKVFAEPGQEPGTTLLYVSHRGEELVPQGEKLVWQARARDIALERKIVERIEEELSGLARDIAEPSAISNGGSSSFAATQSSADPGRAELISAGGGKVYLAISEEFPSAWKSIAIALAAVGVAVEQEDERRGLYFIRLPTTGEEQKEGMLSKLKFWGDDDPQFQLSLTGVGDKTEIVVLNKDSKWETSERAGQLLSQLNQELNKRI